ncbi:MAG: adaptor protein MecA [Peptococcaceae bacterium]|nr:adaptor protein MecA [Peptococcaceae bacterium]
MKFRKINEDKIQIILTAQDLEERDFRRWEMMPMSPKLQEFFHDLLERAYKECGFEISDDSQLVVEAYPLNAEAFAIILTRIPAGTQGDPHGAIHFGHFDHDHELEEDPEEVERDCHQVWCFDELEDCIRACSRLEPAQIEESSLYKLDQQYFLAVYTTKEGQLDVAAILGEYGEWSFVPKPYYMEYGTTMIKDHAVTNLASLVRPRE